MVGQMVGQLVIPNIFGEPRGAYWSTENEVAELTIPELRDRLSAC